MIYNSMRWGMNLDRKDIARVQDLYKNREARKIVSVAEELPPIVCPDFMQRSPAKFCVGNDALRIFPIDKFPGFADPNRIWKRAVEVQRAKCKAFGIHISILNFARSTLTAFNSGATEKAFSVLSSVTACCLRERAGMQRFSGRYSFGTPN